MKGILVRKKKRWPGFALAHSLPLEQAIALPGSEAYGDLLARLCRWRESSRRSELVLSLRDTPNLRGWGKGSVMARIMWREGSEL